MKSAVRMCPSLAGRRQRNIGVSKILPKGETHSYWSSANRPVNTIVIVILGVALLFRINVLNSNLEGTVLDNRYYGGSCLPHYIQDMRFRKPYNLQQYTMQVLYTV